jgi:hypothetical protein
MSFEAGNFNETVLNILPSGLKDPVNTNIIFDTKFEGKYAVIYLFFNQ